MKKEKKIRKRRKSELKSMLKKYEGSMDWLEEGELRSWVDAGNSPLDNPEGIIHEDGTQFDFIEWHRTARWVPERMDLQPWTCFDGLKSCIENEYKPQSKKEAVKYLERIRHYFGKELNGFIRFLNSENLTDRYEEFRLFDESGITEELPFL